MTDKKRKQNKSSHPTAAPGIDEEDAFGEQATKAEKENGETTTVTRLVQDEYDPSGK
ncbi:hypothetical protein [Lentibacillus sediminis]|uniref:hypothetical protein n=1 Tax=Lentibacillus sediminis TaxID=1940529 RepID=UPI001863F9D7|nr:hypothetical protein [Lentibacillus sediminis]